MPSTLAELKRVHPDLSDEFHRRRHEEIQGIFDLLLARAEKRGRVRPGLNRRVVQVFFESAVVTVLEHPDLVAAGLSAEENVAFPLLFARVPRRQRPTLWNCGLQTTQRHSS